MFVCNDVCLYVMTYVCMLQIRPVRTETRRYDGEISGIRAGVKRGIKLK